MTPELHAGLLALAAIISIAFALVIQAQNPRSNAARLHAAYGVATAWWFIGVAMVTTGHDFALWARLIHLSIGMLPVVIFHLNVLTIGVAHLHRRSIRIHYAAAATITLICVAAPVFKDTPNEYGWGLFAAYNWLSVLLICSFSIVFAEVIWMYRKALRQADEGSVLHEKLRAFYQGNLVSIIAMVDFLPPMGINVFPFGFAVLTFLNVATMTGSARFRLVEITPEFAAEQILETLPEVVIAVDSQHVVRLANNAAAVLFERDLSDVINTPISDVVSAPELLDALTLPASTPTQVRELSFAGPDGEVSVTRLADSVLHDQRGGVVARVWVLHDLTAQRAAEAEKEMFESWVRKGHRLESLGVLAGGIAHDFNNLLTVILGQADLALLRARDAASVDSQLAAIVGAAEHAEELTAQMLTYSGQGDSSRTLIDLNTVTRAMGELLHVALTKKAEIVYELADDLPLVDADESQMSQVILNLVTNASDALGESPGVVTLRTGFYNAEAALDQGLTTAGPHVYVEIADTGVGMDNQTKAHIFDPFYTTKFTGRGLGLATVFGIVQAHDGSIRVESEAGRGTCFTVAFPAVAGEMSDQSPNESDEACSGDGLALLVDDECEVREVLHQMLLAAGFDVVEAVNGLQAVETFRARKDEITIVLLDVTMPEMDGGEALAIIRSESAGVPVVLMSGYSGAASIDVASDPHAWFLKKPFRSAELSAQIREAIAGVDQSSVS